MNKHRFLIKSYGLSTKNFVTVACARIGVRYWTASFSKKTQCSGALRFFISAIFSDRGCFPTPTLRGGLLPARLALVITDQGCVSSSWLVGSLNIATNTTAHTFKIMLQFGFIWSFTSYYNKFWLEAQHPAGLLSFSCLSYNEGEQPADHYLLGLLCP